jgi:hypothetical protein
MAHTETEARETFLVEHYRPGLTAEELGAWAAKVRDTTGAMEREGKPVRYLSSTVVPTDESLLCTFEAASEQLVRDAYARAGIPFERITAVISGGVRPDGSQQSTREEDK